MGERLCPSCRRSLVESAKFCTECGSRIDFQSTRKELDDYELKEFGGLKVSKATGITNPFHSNLNELTEKILNPELKPLPEKKRIVFREWKSSGSEGVSEVNKVEGAFAGLPETILEDTDNIVIEKGVTEVSDKEVEEIGLREEATDFETLKGLFEGDGTEGTDVTKPEEQPDEIPQFESAGEDTESEVKEEPGLREEPTDFESLKVLFEGDGVEEIEVTEPEEQSDEILDSESVEEDPESETEEELELREEPTGFESLKTILEEGENDNIAGTKSEKPPEGIPEQENVESRLEIKPEELSENEREFTSSLERDEKLDSLKQAEMDYFVAEIGEKLINSIGEENVDSMAEIKENRIITTPVSGGFKKREAQAEQMKDVIGFLKKKGKGE